MARARGINQVMVSVMNEDLIEVTSSIYKRKKCFPEKTIFELIMSMLWGREDGERRWQRKYDRLT